MGEVGVDHRGNHEEPMNEQDLTDQMLQWARDRMATERSTSPAPIPTGEVVASADPAPRGHPRLIVVAAHEGMTDWGEAHLFDDAESAASFVASLVEGGLDQERITVFNGRPMGIAVTYRPVVEIKKEEEVAS
jgi:hypothetical protein